MKKEIQIQSTDGKNTLHVVQWRPIDEPKAIVQISHGMIEYIERYNDFAEYLTQNGIAVIGNDHLGHGHTAKDDSDLGYFGEGKSATVVDDLHKVTEYAKKELGEDKPYFLFGHSMGSFMARRYLMTYGDCLDGAIICGTGYTPGAILGVGGFVAGWLKLIKGERYRSPFLKKLSFTGYDKRIPNKKTDNDWLSVNEENVEKYNADKYCTFGFTVNGYQTLFEVLKFIQKKENYVKIPKDLPLLFIAGSEDPVGNYGEGVKKVYQQYKEVDIKDVKMNLFAGDRHEILNEDDKQEVYKKVIFWIISKMLKNTGEM